MGKDRNEEAIEVLNRIRPKADVDAGLTTSEAGTIREAIQADLEQTSWMDLFVQALIQQPIEY